MPSTNGHVKEAPNHIPPQSIEAEEALLGSLIIDPAVIHEVSLFLQPEHFYRVANRWIYEAILFLSDHEEPIDLLTIFERLRNKGQLEELGGEGEIIRLVNAVPTSINAVQYARIIEEAAVRRSLLGASSTIAKLAYQEDEDIQDQLAAADATLMGIRNGRIKDAPTRPREYASNWLDYIERMRLSDAPLIGLPSPWLDLNKMLSGFIPGKIYYVGARPGMGKSSLLINMAAHLTLDLGKRILLWSGEMDTNQILNRIAADRTRIPLAKIRLGDLTDDEHGRVMQVGGMIADSGLIIDETAGIKPSQLRALCSREHMLGGLDAVLVDYVGLMSPDRFLNNQNAEITETSRTLVSTARSLNIPIIAASQLSRDVEKRANKRPNLSDLRDSGSLEQDGFAVLFLYRDDYYNELSERPNVTEVIVAKHREGPSGTVSLYWQAQVTAFRNLDATPVDLNHYKNGSPIQF